MNLSLRLENIILCSQFLVPNYFVAHCPCPGGKRHPAGERKKKKKSKYGIKASLDTIKVTKQDKQAAEQLAVDHKALWNKCCEMVFVQACTARGMTIRELYPRQRSSFKHLPGMKAGPRPKKWQIDMMYAKFEETRIEKIALVLSNVRHMEEEQAELSKRAANRRQKLETELEEQMQDAQEQRDQMRAQRDKYEQVLEQQNEAIIDAHKQKHWRIKNMQERRKQMAETQMNNMKMKKLLRDSKSSTRRNLLRVQAECTRRAHEKERVRKKQEQEKRKSEKEELARQKLARHKASIEKKRVAREREEKQRQAQIRHDKKRRELEARLAKKNASQQKCRRQLADQRRRKTLKKKLENQMRAQNVERLGTSLKNAKRLKTSKKIWESDYRMQTEKEIKHAFAVEWKAIKRDETIRRDQWKRQNPVQRNITPGPAAYESKSTLKKSGGAWSYHKSKTDIDWIEKRSAEIPGPGQYRIPTGLNQKGGAWSNFKPKTDVELAMLRASKTPGPADYGNPRRPGSANKGARFCEYKPKSTLDWVIHRANDVPAPGHCQPTSKRKTKNIVQLRKQYSTVLNKKSSKVKSSRF